jgi:hypothetical protein
MRRKVAARERATTAKDPKLRVWPLALGAVGFVCGGFGPIVLSPDADQRALFGLLITGPGGAALGLVSGLIARRLPLQPGARWELLGACCLVLALLVVFSALPEPKPCGEIIDAEVRGCTPPGPDAGAVLELHILRRRGIFENQKPWNRGKLLARPWQPDDETKPYFARLAGARRRLHRAETPRLLPDSRGRSRHRGADALPGASSCSCSGPSRKNTCASPGSLHAGEARENSLLQPWDARD